MLHVSHGQKALCFVNSNKDQSQDADFEEQQGVLRKERAMLYHQKKGLCSGNV